MPRNVVRIVVQLVAVGLLASGCGIGSGEDAQPLDNESSDSDSTSDVVILDAVGPDSGLIEVRWNPTTIPDGSRFLAPSIETTVLLRFDGADYEMESEFAGNGFFRRAVDDRYFMMTEFDEKFIPAGMPVPGFEEVDAAVAKDQFEAARATLAGALPVPSKSALVDQLVGLGATVEESEGHVRGTVRGTALNIAAPVDLPIALSYWGAGTGTDAFTSQLIEFDFEFGEAGLVSATSRAKGESSLGMVDAEVTATITSLDTELTIPDLAASAEFQESFNGMFEDITGDPFESLTPEEVAEYEELIEGKDICFGELAAVAFSRAADDIAAAADCLEGEGEDRLAELIAKVEPK